MNFNCEVEWLSQCFLMHGMKCDILDMCLWLQLMKTSEYKRLNVVSVEDIRRQTFKQKNIIKESERTNIMKEVQY